MSKITLLLLSIIKPIYSSIKEIFIEPKLVTNPAEQLTRNKRWELWNTGAEKVYDLNDESSLDHMSGYAAVLCKECTRLPGANWLPDWDQVTGRTVLPVPADYALPDPFTFKTPTSVKAFVQGILSGKHDPESYICIFDPLLVDDVRRLHNRTTQTIKLLWYEPSGLLYTRLVPRSVPKGEERLSGCYWTSDERTYQRSIFYRKIRSGLLDHTLPTSYISARLERDLQDKSAMLVYKLSDRNKLYGLAGLRPEIAGKLCTTADEILVSLRELTDKAAKEEQSLPPFEVLIDEKKMYLGLHPEHDLESSYLYLTDQKPTKTKFAWTAKGAEAPVYSDHATSSQYRRDLSADTTSFIHRPL